MKNEEIIIALTIGTTVLSSYLAGAAILLRFYKSKGEEWLTSYYENDKLLSMPFILSTVAHITLFSIISILLAIPLVPESKQLILKYFSAILSGDDAIIELLLITIALMVLFSLDSWRFRKHARAYRQFHKSYESYLEKWMPWYILFAFIGGLCLPVFKGIDPGFIEEIRNIIEQYQAESYANNNGVPIVESAVNNSNNDDEITYYKYVIHFLFLFAPPQIYWFIKGSKKQFDNCLVKLFFTYFVTAVFILISVFLFLNNQQILAAILFFIGAAIAVFAWLYHLIASIRYKEKSNL